MQAPHDGGTVVQMSQQRALEAQGKLIARKDKRFVAKLAGQKWSDKEQKSSGRPSSGRPSSPAKSGGQHDEQLTSALPESSGPVYVPERPLSSLKHRAVSPVSRITLGFQPPEVRGSSSRAIAGPSATRPSRGITDDETAREVYTRSLSSTGTADLCMEACERQQQDYSPLSADDWQVVLSAPTVTTDGRASSVTRKIETWMPYDPADGPTREQVETAYLAETACRHSDRNTANAKPGSPSWLVKATIKGGQIHTAPLQVESSLYANWAASYTPEETAAATVHSPAFANTAVASAAIRKPAGATQQFASNSSVAAGEGHSQLQNTIGSVTGNAIAHVTDASMSSSSPEMSPYLLTATGDRPSSPTQMRRAAAAVAGIGRAGMNVKYQGWLRQQFPGVKPPRREDAESLQSWLTQQLLQLHQQLQTKSSNAGSGPANRQHQSETQGGNSFFSTSAGDLMSSRGDRRSISPAGTRRPVASAHMTASEHASMAGSATKDLSADKAWLETGLEMQTSQLLLQAHGPEGVLDIDKLQQQEAVYSAAFHELCRQVSVGCAERGHLMAQLWLSLRAMLLAALEDRQAAHVSEAVAHAATAAVREEVDRVQTLQEDEKVALKAISERHAAKAETAQQQMEEYKRKCEKLQDLLERLSAAQHLVQRVFDLEKVNGDHATTIKRLENQIDALHEQAEDLNRQMQAWKARALAAEGVRQDLIQQLGCSTPRPRRDLGLLSDMLTPKEADIVEHALIAGVPALHVHRLLLGLSPEGDDMRPWMDLAGCALQALKGAKDPYQMYQQLQQLLVGCDALGMLKHLQPPESIEVVSQAVHVGAAPAMLMQLLNGSLGLPAFGQDDKLLSDQAAVQTAAGNNAALTKLDFTRASTGAAISSGSNASAAKDTNVMQPEHQQQRQSVAINSSDRLKAQQVVSTFGSGMPFLPVVGVLATKYGHDANEIGGPVTEALVHAQLSTKSRVTDLQQKSKSLHREVVLLKRTLAEQRKHEQEMIDLALRDQKRKIARREARQLNVLEKFLQTKWGDYFVGIGLLDELPRVLRANVPINNKRMPKRDAEKLAREIWQAKDEQEAGTGVRMHLADFTATFLEKRFFSIPRLVTEVAYNLIYSLGQHSYDADCNLFLRVFTGDVEEAVRFEQQALEAEIMKLLRLLDVSVNHQATGWLHKADVKTALAGFFKGKKVDRLSEIFEALDTDESGDAVHYSALFADDDDDMNQGMTAETIRGQHLQERLEFMQEIENVIRDTAEDNHTTSLTPAVLQTCLQKVSLNLPPERALDEATQDAFIARAFGPYWKDQLYRTSLPMGVVIRAIRRGSLQAAMRGLAAATAAVAVNKIQAVGKFKGKLMTALKVGMNEAASSGGSKDRRSSSYGTTADGMATDRRRSTVEKGDALATSSAAAYVAGHDQQAKTAAHRSRRATTDAVSAAVAAVLADKGGPANSKQNQCVSKVHTVSACPMPVGAASTRRVSVSGKSQAASAGSPERQQSSRAGAPAATADKELSPGPASAAAPESQPVDTLTRSSSSFVRANVGTTGSGSTRRSGTEAVALVPSLSLRRAASGSHGSLSPTRSGRFGLGSARLSSVRDNAAAGEPSKAAASTAITVGMLGAMEAVRQSWLKEEERKLSTSGSGATPAAAAAAKTSFVGLFSLSGGSSTAAADPELQLQQFHQQLQQQAAGDSGGCNYSRAGSFGIPAIPALRLLDISDGDLVATDGMSHRSTNAPSIASSIANTARDEAVTPVAAESYRPQSPVKPILRRTETGRSNKHVQITLEEGGNSAWEGLSSPRSPAASAPAAVGSKSWKGHQFRHQLTLQIEGGDSACTAGAAGTDSVPTSPSGLLRHISGVPSSPSGLIRHSSRAGLEAAACSTPKGSKSRSSNTKKDKQPPMLLLTDADDVIAAAAAAATPGAGVSSGTGVLLVPGPNGSSTAVPGVAAGGSSDSPGFPACGGHCLLRGGSSSGGMLGPLAQEDVCYTPHAPEEGGRLNAMLMRKLNKGKSLQRLEEVMLMVASRAADAADGQEDWG